VLSTDLSSLIHPLSPIGDAPLSRVNEYLTSITGVHLNYDVVVEAPEDPPNPHRRFPMSRQTVLNSYSDIKQRSWEYGDACKR
jgi:hypothetical protein